MSNRAKPAIELIEMFQNTYPTFKGKGSIAYDINRAYHRVNGKFVPVGYSIQAAGIILLFSDAEVDDFIFENY